MEIVVGAGAFIVVAAIIVGLFIITDKVEKK